MSTFKRYSTIALAALAGCAAMPLGGCRGDHNEAPPRQFLPDMDDQGKYKAQSESGFFKEFADHETGRRYGRTMRTPVANTVPFGSHSHVGTFLDVDFNRRADYAREDRRVYEGMELDDTYVKFIPITVDRELLELGKQKFEIFCMPCHGGTGDGKGMVGQRWSYDIPSFHDPKYFAGGEKGDDGFIFWTIRHGVPNVGGPYPLKMPAYDSKVDVRETWAIVSYIRALQATRAGASSAAVEQRGVDPAGAASEPTQAGAGRGAEASS